MIGHLFTALRAGVELSNSAAWKRGGVAVASLTALLSALTGIAVARGWLPSEIDPEAVMQISSGIVALVGVFLGYVQTATTKKIGLGPAPDDGLIHTSDQLTQHIHNGRSVPFGPDQAEATIRLFSPNSTTGYVHGPQPEAVDDLIRQTQILDPAELSRRIQRGDLAGQRPGLPPQPVPPDRPGFWTDPQRGPFLD